MGKRPGKIPGRDGSNLETGSLGQEIPVLFVGALEGNPQGPGEGQAEHLHEALAVHPLAAVVQVNRVGLLGGYFYKIFHIPDRAKTYHKFSGIFHLALYKPFCFVYNGGRIAEFPIRCIISNSRKNAIVALDDSDNNSIYKLAVFTNENQFLYIGMQDQSI